ncbi:MAG: LacI family DNA-binding transcriptional regulator [Chloroflexota bacterium]
MTIKDIAKAANVSHTTVSRALRGHPAIASTTVTRIQQLADELGYIPNSVARGLKMRRSGVLGVIVRRIVDPFFSEVLQGIEDITNARGYSLFLAASHREPERERKIIEVMSQRRVDGVIICSTEVDETHRQSLERVGVRTVLVHNQAPQDTTHSIYHDDIGGGFEIANHLLSLGHRNIAYVGNAHAGRNNEDRVRGFQQAMAKAGLAIPEDYIVYVDNGHPKGGSEGAERLLGLEKRPSAIICFNDMMAVGAIQALQQAGLTVPDDCSVTGFDNIELAAYVTPPLTTFEQPKYRIGCEAANMMLQLLDSDNDKEPTEPISNMLMLQGELCVRASTAPPKK